MEQRHIKQQAEGRRGREGPQGAARGDASELFVILKKNTTKALNRRNMRRIETPKLDPFVLDWVFVSEGDGQDWPGKGVYHFYFLPNAANSKRTSRKR